MELSDGRTVMFGDEPDIAFYKGDRIRAAVEVKGGTSHLTLLSKGWLTSGLAPVK
jgi:hypothetical protein